MNRKGSSRRKLSTITAGVTLSAGLGLSLLASPAFAAEGTAPGEGQGSARHAAVVKCLEDAGITRPEHPKAVRKALRHDRDALEAKRKEIHEALKNCGIDVPTKDEMQARAEAMRACLTEQGIKPPPGPPSADRKVAAGRPSRGGQVGEQHRKVREAIRECRRELRNSHA